MTDEVVAVMRDLAGAGMTMLVVTHEMRVATELATRVWVIDRGTIAACGGARPMLAAARTVGGGDFAKVLDDQLAPVLAKVAARCAAAAK